MFLRNETATRNLRFRRLVTEAGNCTRCSAMCGRAAVLSALNGPLSSRLMFVGEAPGRKGADRTRVPFSGDQSGKNFDRFLASIAINRSQIFITSAALCNPRTAKGANRKPSRAEIINCADFLHQTIEVVDPKIIVTLGCVALEALKQIQSHDLNLRNAAATIQVWNGRVLVPLYHPSPQVLASHRPEAVQLNDYKIVAEALKGLE